MPPKKKSSSPKKKRAVSAPAAVIPIIDDKLPPIQSTQNAVISHTIASSDLISLSRLVTHYNYSKSLNTVDMNLSTPIHLAVKKEDIRILETLLSYNIIDLNALELRSIGGYSALHHACRLNNIEMVKILLVAGANPNIKCNSTLGETPLQICCKYNLINCSKLLLDYGASTVIEDNFGNNASFWAYNHHNESLIKELGLNPPKMATANDLLKLMLKRNPNFVLPGIKKSKGKKSKDAKGGKKKKK
eukprot:gene12816-17183_t